MRYLKIQGTIKFSICKVSYIVYAPSFCFRLQNSCKHSKKALRRKVKETFQINILISQLKMKRKCGRQEVGDVTIDSKQSCQLRSFTQDPGKPGSSHKIQENLDLLHKIHVVGKHGYLTTKLILATHHRINIKTSKLKKIIIVCVLLIQMKKILALLCLPSIG